ncbi:ABC transporter substrate-binding protein [Motiliproteus sp. MSK22-1]|uniref:ABC transporter substrate-binding protein n=1 Tax=Motiliproteus sp. MSK22-1 TaxID=1897630 RepID=UPI000977A3FC|nr:ABC transporter substrate-binding protein [Motiliproteus sp. MSK22-1]OMH33792.1 ABC transporter substrate-binding protein [Motiliproteus sp. MSK22-1]
MLQTRFPQLFYFLLVALIPALIPVSDFSVYADIREARYWLETEFSETTLEPEQQLREMEWFITAAKPYRNMTVRVVSERIDAHFYEANTLAKAFEDITGIKVIHEVTGEDDVIKKLQAQIDLNFSIYDAYINDSDLIGTHFRSNNVVPISEFIAGDGAEVTLPTLDLEDFIGLRFTTAPDGKIYQLPDQQFANLYWYRHDWFSRPELKQQFQARYGYELNVPKNWSAYEDIAEFFSVYVKEIDGQRVYGHMDYGNADPSLGWRFSDAWLSMAGVGDPGIPNGLPVDEWGIRIEGCRPVGASVARGGALNSPAAIYATRKFVDWLHKYAPPEAQRMNFTQAGAVPGRGNIAQQIFWYTAFTAAMTDPALPVNDADGTPKWRMAPSPHGAYWQQGMKLGYQDVGAWTFLKSTPVNRRKAAWLYAQFVVSKTVSLRKTLVGLAPIRLSDIESEYFTDIAHKYGGLVEFYRSPARNYWTPTGSNVPDYPGLSNLWWQNIGAAVDGSKSAEQVMNQLAVRMDQEMGRLQFQMKGPCRPALNPVQSEDYWYQQPGAPKAKLVNENPKGVTQSYPQSLERWR